MGRSITYLLVLVVLPAGAVSGKPPMRSQASASLAVVVTSMPAASGPVDVRVTALPPMPVPTIRMPPDESTHQLVKATWALVLVTAVLAGAAFVTTWVQSRETRKRDRAILTRDVSRAAYRLIAEMDRAKQLAELVAQSFSVMWTPLAKFSDARMATALLELDRQQAQLDTLIAILTTEKAEHDKKIAAMGIVT
jgi:hypothetical protein